MCVIRLPVKMDTVLRFPPYYCIFNPLELIWHQVKSNVRRHSTHPTLCPCVVELVKNVVGNVSANSSIIIVTQT